VLRTFLVMIAILGMTVVAACGEDEEAPDLTAVPSPTVSPTSPTATGTVGPTPTLVPASPVATVELPIGKVAFHTRRDGKGEIYLLTPGEEEVNITNSPEAEDANPDISPDGSKILFSSDLEGGVFHIYLVNVDGSGLTKLTDDPAGDFSPRWSPDGKRIAFSRTGAIYVMDSDGSNVRKVTEPESEATAAPCKAGGFLGGWSPDGERLTFYAASATRSLGQVCTVKLDGSDLTVVVSDPPGWQVEPAWSPDGEWIVYRSIRDDNHEIYIVKPDGTSDTNLTNSPATDLEPTWSPDGEWIVFGSNRTGDFDLYIMRPDGSDLGRITTAVGKDSDPAWGP
jgi:Tol biopolymer transport system component